MVVVTRLRALLVLGLSLLGACGRERSAEDTVRLYFASLGRDPIRAASLTSGLYQAEHGLRFSTSASVAAWGRRVRRGESSPAGAATPEAGRGAVDSEALVMWLATQAKDGFAERAESLSIEVLEARESRDTAEIVMRVRPPRAPAFRQHFSLSHDSAGRFVIDRIVQEGVEADSLPDAFVAAPSEERRRRLAAALGVPSD